MEENKPIQTTQTQAVGSETKVEQPKRPLSKKLIGIIVGVVVVVIAAVAFFLLRPSAPTEEGLNPPPNDVIVTVGDHLIFRSDIEAAAEEQYDKQAITKDVLKQYLNILIERIILDQEAKKLGVTVTPKEINDQMAKSLAIKRGTLPESSVVNSIKYQILKNKVMEKVVNSRTAYVISFWTPPSDYPDEPNIPQSQIKKEAQQKQQAQTALPAIAELMRTGVNPLEATKRVMTQIQYADLAEIISLNGTNINNYGNNTIDLPYVYTERDKQGMGTDFFDIIFAMKKGDIRVAFGKDNATGWVIQVVEAANSQYNSYSQWYAAQVKQLVQIQSSL